jgi:HEPN domain-containing protein
MNVPSPSEWIVHAHSDLEVARLALTSSKVLLEDVCFHAQQCVEKALKGLLLSRGTPIVKTHDIRVLVTLLDDLSIVLPEKLTDIDRLTSFATIARYPGFWETTTRSEAEYFIQQADQTLKWVEELLRDQND